jgi:hypothetical protein
MPIKVLMILFAGSLFFVSAAAHLYAKLRLRPRDDSDLDDYYHEFEDQHPGLARYNAWCRVTLTGVIIAMLLMFLAVVL